MVVKIKYRWLLVIVLAVAVLLGAAALPRIHAVGSPGDADRVLLPIVMYHEIKTFNNNRLAITPDEFASDLGYLQAEGYTPVTMTDVIRFVNNGAALPAKPIVLTFDDGYLNNYKYALPLLEKYHMKAVLSVIAKNADDFTRVPDNHLDYAHCTWAQLKEMADSGCIELQNHTYNLHSITGRRYGCSRSPGESLTHYTQVLDSDLSLCQSEIFRNTGVLPNTFTYPYGSVCPDSVPIIKSLGFQASLSCRYGINVIGRDPETLYGLKRISRYHQVSLKKTLEEAMKTLKYSKN